MEKEDIVLIPSSGIFNEGTDFWNDVLINLKRKGYTKIELVKFHLRNRKFFQEPPEGLGEISLSADVSDCRAQIMRIKRIYGQDKKYVFIGHSKSGLIGQVLAQEDLFDGLIALNPAMPKGISALSASAFWCMKSVLARAVCKLSIEIAVRRSYKDTVLGALHPNMSDETKTRIFQSLVWESSKVIWDLSFNKPKVDPASIKVPILFVGGDRDMLVRIRSIKTLFGQYLKQSAKAELLVLEDGAHYPFWGEQSETLIDKMDQWIVRRFCS